jgi:hypothetical protein
MLDSEWETTASTRGDDTSLVDLLRQVLRQTDEAMGIAAATASNSVFPATAARAS